MSNKQYEIRKKYKNAATLAYDSELKGFDFQTYSGNARKWINK